jgi:hypothetical protein
MTSKQRLDRLERIAKLFVRAGLRARRNMKEQDEKINIIINNQIEYDERFAGLNRSLDRSHNELSQSLQWSHNELSQSIERSHNELSQSLKWSHSELSQSIERSHNELSQSLKESHKELAKAQLHTNQRLDSLIDIVRRDRNGNSN